MPSEQYNNSNKDYIVVSFICYKECCNPPTVMIQIDYLKTDISERSNLFCTCICIKILTFGIGIGRYTGRWGKCAICVSVLPSKYDVGVSLLSILYLFIYLMYLYICHMLLFIQILYFHCHFTKENSPLLVYTLLELCSAMHCMLFVTVRHIIK